MEGREDGVLVACSCGKLDVAGDGRRDVDALLSLAWLAKQVRTGKEMQSSLRDDQVDVENWCCEE